MENPRYDHWCENCIFLGRYTGPKHKVRYDLYWCPMHGPEARHGDFPKDCASGVKFASSHEGLMEALRRYRVISIEKSAGA